MEIKSLEKIDFDTLFRAFGRAFADYEVQLNAEQLRAMLTRRGFDPALSFAAFDGVQIAAFTLNGIGNFNGVPTAYDTGTGTLKEYRGTGLATEIFRHSMPHLRRAGVGQYLLEVLQHNTKAVSVYRNLGFETVREFNYFCRANTEIADRGDTPRLPHSVRRTDPEKFASISSFWDFTPSWQNSFESIGRAAGDFVSLGVFTEEELAGYCVFEPASGDVAQIAVKRQYRRKGIAGLLLREMLRLNRNDSIKIINTDVSCGSITGFLQAKNIVPQGKQFEMIRKI
ncbi:GNAT family N-acetyltransferase [Alistipes finegoldii]|uniref:GNAT family N-acetyltransferase n=1 Tax=Alistipes finegoldii TaxID=214856 RepID=UPI002665F62B|nr:GNAT family N-acetyltransferase [Alistipes finegoldii]